MKFGRSGIRRIGVVLVLVLMSSVVLQAGSPAQVGGPLPPAPERENLEGLFSRISEAIPSFAGMYVEEPRAYMVVRVKGGSLAEGVRAAALLQRELEEEHGSLGAPKVLDAAYTFSELKAWHDRLKVQALTMENVVSADLDERLNRIDLGISDRSAREAVRRLAGTLDIPARAITFHREKPAVKLGSLRDRHRPLVGGLQIAFSAGLCTLGVPVTRGGVNGFVTNSHCSTVEAGPDSTVFHQHTASGTTNRVGVEAADPTYFTGGACVWSGYKCRYSDALFASLSTGVTSSRGVIAKTAIGSFFWPNTADRYTVTTEASYGITGLTVYKVGRTTGRTQGSIFDTCVDYAFHSLKVVLICQEVTNLKSQSGDSGSAVFRIPNAGSNNVTLYGIMWGGPADTTTYYGAWGWAIEDAATELGPMCARPTC